MGKSRLVRVEVLLCAALGVACLSLAPVGCNGGGSHAKDGGPDGRTDAATDRGGSDATKPVCLDAGARKVTGEACSCDGDCQSGFCVDGVCCNSACQETCKACNTQESMGTCSFVPAGLTPRADSTCPKSDVATCGNDGTCDGKGACRTYVDGTVCKAGTCDGAAVTNRQLCDGAGHCQPGEAKVCVPFSCEVAKQACFSACTSNTDCAGGHQCVAGSCGPKMKGANCAKDEDCASGFCTDGLCCAVACQGACVSCNQVGREGTCWPIDQGNADPRKICQDSGAMSCGQTGTCDGFGTCTKYGPETVCVLPSCAGDRLNTAGTCDGQGTCLPSGVQDCPPYRCAAGACNTICNSDAECVAGIACVNHSCGLKQDGGSCTKPTDCKSNFCVDGVCCNEGCGGSCRSCALPSSRGKCTPLAAGASDSRKVCKDAGVASCGADGRCDGAGGCRTYKVGTICGGEKCASSVYTGPSTCNSTGQCTAPSSRPCFPFACNGQQCFDACTVSANCVAPNVCNGNSCGPKLPGAGCSANAECASNVCAQGVCCATTCNAACKSCALAGTAGTCTNVATGTTDPKGLCLDQGAASCGNNGRCAAGACQKYGAGLKCKDSTCPAATTTFTGQSTCDGAGKCNTPAATSCFPYSCGTLTCRSTCTANADCAPNAVCLNGSCGLQPKGGACNATNQCAAGLVCSAQKVCCNAVCDGPCVSCTLSATLGTCSPIAAGNADPSGQCGVAMAATCGNDGKCDGVGQCHKYPGGTPCAQPSCPAGTSTVTLGKTCNGLGTCSVGGGTGACAPFMCNGTTACNQTCTSNGDCVPPNTCVGNVCGKKPAGAPCSTTDQCTAGLSCTDGFCCTSASCGACKACNATGACQNADGTACSAMDMCHVTDGMCSGGACQRTTISCDDNNPCTTDSCNPTTGCVHTPVANTVTCNDGNACTKTDLCTNGVCTGSNPVSCMALDPCHSGGTCDPATGTCTGAPLTGTTCDDRNACTTGDTCQAGVCVGGTPKTCTALDQCHVAGTCDPTSGTCSNPPKLSGACDDGNACTTGDACQGGVCAGAPVVCMALDQCHDVGTCSGGTCSNPPKAAGSPCSDGDACTQGDTCVSGTCSPGPQKACPGPVCHGAGTCSGGTCGNYPPLDGTACDDGDACTVSDTCQSGTCVSGAPLVCTASDQCHDPPACDKKGACKGNPQKPDGTPCTDDGDPCTTNTCQIGSCTSAPLCPGQMCDPVLVVCF